MKLKCLILNNEDVINAIKKDIKFKSVFLHKDKEGIIAEIVKIDEYLMTKFNCIIEPFEIGEGEKTFFNLKDFFKCMLKGKDEICFLCIY